MLKRKLNHGLFLAIVSIILAGCGVQIQNSAGTATSNAIDKIDTNVVESTEDAKSSTSPTKTMSQVSLKPSEELLNLKSGQKISAVISTNQGDITVDLFADKTPVTVANFVGLAEGKQSWIDPQTGSVKENTPLYDGLIFHRVMADFMIQGGDPLGTGVGGPGYKFQDEFVSELKFDKPGYLAMANSGPGTNGSQFFITVVPTEWLNQHHTIFGKVTAGMDVVNKIAVTKTDQNDRPVENVVIKKITIVRK